MKKITKIAVVGSATEKIKKFMEEKESVTKSGKIKQVPETD